METDDWRRDYTPQNNSHSLGILIEWKLEWKPMTSGASWQPSADSHSLGILIEWKHVRRPYFSRALGQDEFPLAGDIN